MGEPAAAVELGIKAGCVPNVSVLRLDCTKPNQVALELVSPRHAVKVSGVGIAGRRDSKTSETRRRTRISPAAQGAPLQRLQVFSAGAHTAGYVTTPLTYETVPAGRIHSVGWPVISAMRSKSWS